VRRRQLDRLAHLRHAADERQRPRRREHVDAAGAFLLLEREQQALRHDHVADPGRPDDEHGRQRLSPAAHG
jgi:hypothetical protein